VLRTAVLVVACAVTLLGAVLCLSGIWAPGAQLLVVGAIVSIGVVVERWRYRNQARPDADWEATSERFVDPSTGKRVRVEYDSKSGSRRYVSDDHDDH
jgi:hypothetical protein